MTPPLTVPVAAQTSSTAPAQPLAIAVPPEGGAAIHLPIAAAAVRISLALAVPQPTSPRTARAGPTARSASARPLETAAPPATFVVTLPLTAVPGASPGSETARRGTTSLPTAPVGRTARRVRAQPLVTAAPPAAFVEGPMITVMPVASLLLGTAPRVVATFQRMVLVVRTVKHARGPPSVTAAPRAVSVAGILNTAAPDARLVLEPVPLPAVIYQPTVRAARMARLAKALLSAPVALLMDSAAARPTIAVLDVRPHSALATQGRETYPPTAAVGRTARPARDQRLATAAQPMAIAARQRTTADPGVRPPLGPVPALDLTFRRMVVAGRTVRPVRAQPSETVVQPMAIAVRRVTTVVLGVSHPSEHAAVVRAQFPQTGPAAQRTGRHVLGRPLETAVQAKVTVETLDLTVARAGK